MRILALQDARVTAFDTFDAAAATPLADNGFLWIACTHDEFGTQQKAIHQALIALCGTQLVDLHVSDLLNPYLPSHYDYTYQYEILVFRRLSGTAVAREQEEGNSGFSRRTRGGPPILRRIHTRPVGFALFDRVLLSIHPEACSAHATIASQLLRSIPTDSRTTANRPPTGPADLMLRIISLMVDGFLELRRELTHQIDRWQSELLDPRSRFNNWSAMLEARLTLHYLDEICDDQRTAIQDWNEALEALANPTTDQRRREHDLLKVRSRDVLEHIERVAHHVRRLEQSTETAVQMHFNSQGYRTNNIMRTLTTLTAIFLPLNLIAAIFGMNFDSLPLIHQHSGFWWALGSMGFIALTLCLFFWRKNYLSRSEK